MKTLSSGLDTATSLLGTLSRQVSRLTGKFFSGRRSINHALVVCGIATVVAAPMAVSAQSATQAYQLNSGDKIKVTVFGHEDLSGEFEVDPAGNIILPLIKDVAARGNSSTQLEAAIGDKLSPDYLKNPKVSVEVLTYRPIYVLGEVERPGSYTYSNGMTVIESIALAGGFTYRARKKRITVTRGASDSKEKIKVDDNTVILPGDVIQIPERRF